MNKASNPGKYSAEDLIAGFTEGICFPGAKRDLSWISAPSAIQSGAAGAGSESTRCEGKSSKEAERYEAASKIETVKGV